jgi:phosphomannomutase
VTSRDEILARIFKAYDVRGLVGDELDAALVTDIGAACGEILAARSGSLVVGRDMRPSSPELAAAFAAGVASTGVDVVDIGLVSTDQLYFASGMLDAPGAMFTASHNPAAYNGIKLCRRAAAPVAIDSGLADIRDRIGRVEPAQRPGRIVERDTGPDFRAHVQSFVDTERLAGVRLAVDAGNGMAGLVWPLVTQGLDVVTTPLYFELDGTFPNHPADPLDAANLADLAATLRVGSFDLGLAFDGDADRVFVLDEHGKAVSASIVGAIVAERMLARHPGSVVLHNLICSRTVPERITAAGGIPQRTRVGHSFIKARMAATDAIMAVEHSGHYYYRDHYRADSGVITALLLLEALADAGTSMSGVAARYAGYHASGELNLEVTEVDVLLDEVATRFADRGTHDRLDGLTVDLGDAWFNLRPSNTEPLLRLNAEAGDEATLTRLVDEVMALTR